MARPVSKHPTELELEVLHVLWDGGPKSGHEIRDQLEPGRKLTYQSVMTILGIMEEKKFVSRKKSGGRYTYRASVTRNATSKKMLRDVVKRLFRGSSHAAMIGLLQSSELDADQISELKQLIKAQEKKGKQ